MKSTQLKDLLSAWSDPDGAIFSLGVSLGLWPDDWLNYGLKYKWIFWSANPLGERLYDCLIKLVEVGMIIESEERQYKWNPDFTVESYDEDINGEWRRNQRRKMNDSNQS